jgi:hypothetical protein
VCLCATGNGPIGKKIGKQPVIRLARPTPGRGVQRLSYATAVMMYPAIGLCALRAETS